MMLEESTASRKTDVFDDIIDGITAMFGEKPKGATISADEIRERLTPRFGAEAVEDALSTLLENKNKPKPRRVSPDFDPMAVFEHFFGDPLDGGLEDLLAENTASRKTKSGTKRVKGYAPWKPHERTKLILVQVGKILEEYHDYLPLTGRQIFYRLVGAYGYEKTEKAYERLTNYLVRARRAGIIPFRKIRDDGAAVRSHHHYRNEDAFYAHIRQQGQNYRRDKLANQRVDIRVYCEAAGMMPQLRDVCEPYSVPVYSCSGFDSLTAKYDLAQTCRNTFAYQGRKTVIFHLGDYDPSGESIFNDGLVEDVHSFLDRDVPHKRPEDVAIFERVALRPGQGGEYDLDPAPPKKSDSRTKNWSGTETYQLEALPPDVLAELLTDAIKRRIDMDIYEEDLETEEAEAQRIAKALPAPAS